LLPQRALQDRQCGLTQVDGVGGVGAQRRTGYRISPRGSGDDQLGLCRPGVQGQPCAVVGNFSFRHREAESRAEAVGLPIARFDSHAHRSQILATFHSRHRDWCGVYRDLSVAEWLIHGVHSSVGRASANADDGVIQSCQSRRAAAAAVRHAAPTESDCGCTAGICPPTGHLRRVTLCRGECSRPRSGQSAAIADLMRLRPDRSGAVADRSGPPGSPLAITHQHLRRRRRLLATAVYTARDHP
jgi:hypothetical protein